MHHLGSLLSATIEYYAADQIEMYFFEKKKEKKNRFRVCAANHQGVSKTGALSI